SRDLARRHRLSERQARRYVERARDEGAMELPGRKVVFTVKLPAALAKRVRRAAKATGHSISALVSEALSEFLERHDDRAS
ncbi:MAG: ribbon-helix-helix protein, CopG family, partial [Acidimicrobiales bacterium]